MGIVDLRSFMDLVRDFSRGGGLSRGREEQTLFMAQHQNIRNVGHLSQAIRWCCMLPTTHLASRTSPSQPEISSGAALWTNTEKFIPMALPAPSGLFSEAPFSMGLLVSRGGKCMPARTWSSFVKNSYLDCYLFAYYKFKPLGCFLFSWIFAPKYFVVVQKGFLKKITYLFG